MSNLSRAFASPMRYIQGSGEINHLSKYCKNYGQKVLILIDSFLYDKTMKLIEPQFEDDNTMLAIRFNGECCQEEVDRIYNSLDEFSAEVLVAIGGGKTLDTVKLMAAQKNLPVIVVPTSAATDAPTSALSVLYTADGEYIKNIKHQRNADLVLLDTEIISRAPVRLLVAGMGDALATYFEAKANKESNHNNLVGSGYGMCLTAYAIAELSYKVLLRDGLNAKIAVENGVVTTALENVIEANTLMSGLGFENAGLACAHGIHAGFTALPETHKYYHGEKVAFGVLTQLVLENAEREVLDEVMSFMYEVGLPLTLAEVGVAATDKNIKIIAHTTAVDNKLIKAEPCAVTEELVFSAIKIANVLGEKYISAQGKADEQEALCN
ncbi:MAG: glycerol dehydrogenase [Eubacteriales bacterium]|nr:glycerol dehydrogenase [Eubacteriales bacterium]